MPKAVTVSGVVLDKATRLPVPYAAVTASSNRTSTQTNSKGAFTLPLNPQHLQGSIRITSLGYMPQDVSIAGLLQEKMGATNLTLLLVPKHERLSEVEVKAKARKWKTKKTGYHIDEGSPFHYEFSPSDTLKAVTPGQEIGNKIYLKNGPAFVQRVSFGLAGSGSEKAAFGIHLYSLKDNLPHRDLLPKPVLITVPPHHTGWISVDLAPYNITLKEDFAVVIEWLTETNRLNSSTLIAFATEPEGQITFYRESDKTPWKIVRSGLLNVKSIGLYATLLYEK
ncbi:carboxypeptidase-like regulatory domain-containing protein [Pontibacter liquoris]|uniref:carboxypeptidase-like regulatory domain-containing protein n=1 Tax=Pontibacter liquoris TaxID=2905677 RepID=UPI001FA6C8BC